jgi:hypothetical protein
MDAYKVLVVSGSRIDMAAYKVLVVSGNRIDMAAYKVLVLSGNRIDMAAYKVLLCPVAGSIWLLTSPRPVTGSTWQPTGSLSPARGLWRQDSRGLQKRGQGKA